MTIPLRVGLVMTACSCAGLQATNEGGEVAGVVSVTKLVRFSPWTHVPPV